MNLYSTFGIFGDILFENDSWIIGLVNEGAFGSRSNGDLDPRSILDACKVRGVVHTNGRLAEYFAPRECGFLAISKKPFVYHLETKDLKAIEKEAANGNMGDPIVRFFALCGGTKKVDARTLFNTAHLKNDRLEYAHSQLNPSSSLHFKNHRGNFTVSNPEGNQGVATGICFSNHFEMIYVPLDNEEKALQCIGRVIERSKLQGRVANDYIVLPVIWDEPQACIRVRQLENMTSKELLAYFGGGKNRGNKMETLSSCLESWTTKHVPFVEVGDVHYVQLNTQTPETPVDCQPIDWTLARASHCEIIHSDQPAPEAMDIFVRIVDEPRDDFAAALYTMFEAQKAPLNVIGVHADKINMLFDEIKARVNAASNA